MSRLVRALPRSRTVRIGAAAGVLALVAGGAVLVLASGGGPAPREERRTLAVTDGPADDQHVSIDTDLFLPVRADAAHPVPAVVLSHGFGGSLDEVRGDALDAAARGYVVLTYSARGFGRSTGLVGLDSPDYEVKDVRQLVDLLAERPEVLHDAPGDPRVGLAGGSYGGGISLLAAAYDRRIDAVAAAITWNDLATAFSPGAVFKQGWASLFFGLGTLDTTGSGRPGPRAVPRECPGFTAEVCRAYADTEARGRAPQSALDLLHRSSVASVADRLHVPTLLLQGERDTLFPLAEAERTAADLQARGVPHQQVWLAGGHDGGFGAETRRVRDATATWFDRYLRRDARVDPGPVFVAARPGTDALRADSPVGLGGHNGGTLGLPIGVRGGIGILGDGPDRPTGPGGPAGPAGPGDLALAAGPPPAAVGSVPAPTSDGTLTIVNPPGGAPAAVTSLPGLGALGALASGLTVDLPPQTAAFDGPRLQAPVEVIGGGTASVAVTSSTGSAVLFVKLYDVDAEGTARLPQGQLTPLRLEGLPRDGAGRDVTVTLPSISWRFATGHHLRLAVSTTDQAWLGNRDGATYTVGTGSGAMLAVPLSPAPAGGGLRPLVLASLAVVALAVVGALLALLGRRRRRRDRTVSAAAAASVGERAAPLVITGLTKEYPGGLRAVDDLTLTVEHGQVLGLLGPNGAGKTTTLRMVLGLVHPSAGQVRLFGTPVAPGSPALARVGAFVEGPGFVPTLSGLDNLRLWWTASGADWADAGSAEALGVAGLGDAIHRRVKTYSQGMRQRLAIAQTMLGRPDLVVLDEPTNGLDPPQIVEMRRVIRRIAERGATVVVSSHQLAEVEQTCTHVAVMARGRLVAAGTVDEVVGADKAVHVEVGDAFAGQAADITSALTGVRTVERDATGLLVALDGLPRPELVAALVRGGVPVDAVTPRRALETAFLELVS